MKRFPPSLLYPLCNQNVPFSKGCNFLLTILHMQELCRVHLFKMPSILTTCKTVMLFKTKEIRCTRIGFLSVYSTPTKPPPSPALQPSSADTHSCIYSDYFRFLLCRLGLTFLFSSCERFCSIQSKVYSKLEKGEKFEYIGPKVNF
jgi:hypothetical protein